MAHDNSKLAALGDLGQSIWLDFIDRDLLQSGRLDALVRQGVAGMTTNPTIFDKAIGHGTAYDRQFFELVDSGLSAAAIVDALIVADVQAACDLLRGVYEHTEHGDGFVSIEVPPALAYNARKTIDEARRLHGAVDRPNLMVKIPGTPAGLAAVRHAVAAGLNINITLLFALGTYEQVVDAYLGGLEDRVLQGRAIDELRSVASFFVSRVDASADRAIDELLAGAPDKTTRAGLQGLKGTLGVANARLAYRRFSEISSSERWHRLAERGANPQRLLWASTSTKNPDYDDLLYVDNLIGPNTVNTMPPGTLDAFRDHGKVRDSLEENVEQARTDLNELEKSGISLDTITADLVKDGVKQFADAADKLYGAVAHKRAVVLGTEVGRQTVASGAELGKKVEKTTEEWRSAAKIRRLWQRDSSVWTGTDEDKWLGWLTSAASADIADYEDFAARVKGEKFSDAVVLGMGGSSLGPEVLAETFPRKSGFPRLHVLDSTDPAQVRAMEKAIDISKTLFIVSSKSGGTTEPNAMKDYFFAPVSEAIGEAKAGHRLVAVTDPGPSLE